MITSTSSARRSALAAMLLTAASLAGCSSGVSHFESDYVSPIAATPAPQPAVPMPTGAPAPARRMPLLPPVPGDEASTGLPPVTMASYLPPNLQ